MDFLIYGARIYQRCAYRFSVNAKRAGDRAHRDSTAVQLDCLCGFLGSESVLTAHDVVSGEVLRDCRAVHIILLSQVSDTVKRPGFSSYLC